MMHGFRDLLHSERGVWCFITIFVSLPLVFLGQLKATEWLDFVKYLTTVLVASKTVTTAIETRTLKEPQIPVAVSPPPH